jgi:hypothetical protein
MTKGAVSVKDHFSGQVEFICHQTEVPLVLNSNGTMMSLFEQNLGIKNGS